ncbi:MAG TPA: hypothetical protein EYP65_05805 [Armatimonadetes bacterium]|nr:hypothetical protein [Armatimonadota bacterium]
MNSKVVDEAIKPSQTKGTFGERHICQRPFEVLPIPRFDPKDRRHLRLSELSKACHKKVLRAMEGGELKLSKSIGSLRRDVRQLLSEELSEIDRLVAELVGFGS